MIVQRQVYEAKWACGEKLVAMLKEECEKAGLSYRIYTSLTGPYQGVVLEMEFESMDKRGKFFAEWGAKSETAAFLEKLGEVVESVDIQLLTLV